MFAQIDKSSGSVVAYSSVNKDHDFWNPHKISI